MPYCAFLNYRHGVFLSYYDTAVRYRRVGMASSAILRGSIRHEVRYGGEKVWHGVRYGGRAVRHRVRYGGESTARSTVRSVSVRYGVRSGGASPRYGTVGVSTARNTILRGSVRHEHCTEGVNTERSTLRGSSHNLCSKRLSVVLDSVP